MTIDYRDGVSIGEVVVYVPLFLSAVYLVFRHRKSSSSAWFYLMLFTLIRVLNGIFELATINNPSETWLYTAYSITSGVAISPMELFILGSLTLVLDAARTQTHVVINSTMVRVFTLVITGALALGIAGGVLAGDAIASTGVYTPNAESKASVAIFIAAYALLVAAAAYTYASCRAWVGADEKRLLLGVLAALPFLLVRVIYSAISIFDNPAAFNQLTGNVTIFLVMALLMELIIVLIFTFIGWTTRSHAPTGESKA